MSDAIFTIPHPVNEPILSYAPGSAEKAAIKKALAELKSVQKDIPMYIGGKKVHTPNKATIHPPHERNHILGHHAIGNADHVKEAIKAALAAKPAWEAMPWQERAAIFIKGSGIFGSQ